MSNAIEPGYPLMCKYCDIWRETWCGDVYNLSYNLRSLLICIEDEAWPVRVGLMVLRKITEKVQALS